MSDTNLLDANDLPLLRLEQAKALKERVLGSCLIVEFIIAYTAVIMAVIASPAIAAGWFAVGTVMVLVTYLYGRFAAAEGITRRNYRSFLRGHRIVSALTGLAWGGYAIFQLDYSAEFTIFLGCLTVCSITLGGIFPSSAYRATYIALATTAITPFGFYLAVTAPGAFKLVGVGLLVYYLFAMFISARVEIETRQTLAARNASMLNERIVAQNQLYLEASEEKSRFLAATSHDLSQPLQSQGFFMTALRDNLDRPEQHELLNRIEESWRAQKDLLLSIVDVSRIDSGAIVPRNVLADLSAECRKLAQDFESTTLDATFTSSIADGVQAQTDPLLFARVVRNLLSNASKFTPSGGRIVFTLEDRDGGPVVTVADTGPGMTFEEQEAVFGEYVRLQDGQGAPGGLGLGLSIVDRLCKLLGISIALSSAPGEGTTFTLQLSKGVTQSDSKPSVSPILDVFEEAPLIVLVDDDAAVVKGMAAVLTGWGCMLITATHGAQAMELVSLTEDNPNLLLIDKRLGPDDDGMDLIAAIREECNAQIPAILMSGNLGQLSGYDDEQAMVYLNKPLAPDDLRIAMEDLLRSRS